MTDGIVKRFASRMQKKATPLMDKPDEKGEEKEELGLFEREEKPMRGKPDFDKPKLDKPDLDDPLLDDEMCALDCVKDKIEESDLSPDDIDELISFLEDKKAEGSDDGIDTEMGRDEANIKDDIKNMKDKPFDKKPEMGGLGSDNMGMY